MASLIVCLDGTWNNADSAEAQTNIGLLASMIDPKPDRGIPAQIYYDAGVGTSGSTTNRLAGGLLGKGLSTNILEAYRFLSLNYRPGDRIYIFGYSRGAYTARSLCGFLSASGLLRADMCDHSNQDFAWKYYLTRPKKRFPADKEHLRRLTHPDVRVRFLGVFDTVGSLGIPRTWLNWIGRRAFQFHDTDVCPIIDYACQALAIDEHRIEFEASVWRQPQHRGYLAVEQVWFPGVHANVGGGYEDRGLSDLTLDWMLKRLRKFCPEVAVSTADLQAEPPRHPVRSAQLAVLAQHLAALDAPDQPLRHQELPRHPAGAHRAPLQADWRDAALERAGKVHGHPQGARPRTLRPGQPASGPRERPRRHHPGGRRRRRAGHPAAPLHAPHGGDAVALSRWCHPGQGRQPASRDPEPDNASCAGSPLRPG